MARLKETVSQTAGPYVHIGCVPSFAGLKGVYGGADPGARMITGEAKGERITISGHVYDGAGAPLRDALIEIWQADAAGLFKTPGGAGDGAPKPDPHFTGWGRQPTDASSGRYEFRTVKPGPVPWPDGRMQAPHIALWIVARGINLGLHTRLYFPDEPEANARDPLLQRIEHKSRIPTLIATPLAGGYSFDIHLQGDLETVFFDV